MPGSGRGITGGAHPIGVTPVLVPTSRHMRWSLRLGSLAGIGVFVHLTFPLLLIYAGYRNYSVRQHWPDAWIGIGFVLVLFGIIVLHELGHALTARRFGIGTQDITLLPIGGVARLERMPDDPRQELLVALAGPAVNVALALFFFALAGGSHEISSWLDMNVVGQDFIMSLVWVNIALTLFNLIPAFPMDGGRVFRSLLALKLSYLLATQIAGRVGQLLAVGFMAVGFFYNPFMIVIGMFVWLGAAQEIRAVRLRAVQDSN